MLDVEKLADDVFEAVRVYTGKAVASLTERLAAVEAREPIRGEKGEQGFPGIVGDRGPEGLQGLPGADGAPGQPGERGEKGDPGPAGKDADEAALGALRAEVLELRALVAELAAKPAVPGPQGEPGPIGPAGLDGKSIEGPEGKPGRDGRDGLPGVQGEKGRDGIDGKNGADGLHGKDGLGCDDFEETFEDGGRTVVRRYTSGDRVKETRHRTKTMIYRGGFIAGTTYEPGDTVTYAGHLWHCDAETMTDKPGDTGGKSWTMAVRKGKDGKDGVLVPPKPHEPLSLR